MPSYETILIDQSVGIARITLNRPDRLNSFTAEMHQELAAALDDLGDACSPYYDRLAGHRLDP